MPQQDEPGSYFQNPPPAEVYGYVENPAELTDGSDDEDQEQDIYRGRRPSPPRSPSPSSSSKTSSSSSSSSSGSVFGGRLGAISAGVEHAISRWARAWTSTSSLSSSSSSSASVITLTKSQTARRRKRRPRSLATLHNARSEREVAARIRAREDLRNIPRGFVLYTPQAAASERGRKRDVPHESVFRTTSLPDVTNRLSAVLRERARVRRTRAEPITPAPSRPLSPLHHDYMLSDESSVARSSSPPGSGVSTPNLPRRGAKGKQRAGLPQDVPSFHGVSTTKSQLPGSLTSRVPKAWWLDVCSPTWEDMCAIGKLLHLHPLTLEDILTQDPREKLELFPKLGYYFISFRAIESQKTRERVRNLLSVDDAALRQTDEGVVGEVNVYLIIFREGICSFHFADIEEHVDRVRTRIMLMGESINTSSDWIAHGIMDSIVDSFFPFLAVIEREVLDIENLVFSLGGNSGLPVKGATTKRRSQSSESDTALLSEKSAAIDADEKQMFVGIDKEKMPSAPRPRFLAPTTLPLLMRRARRAIRDAIASIPRFRSIDEPLPEYRPTTTIHRMARTRRLVTSLARFLAVKSEVVAQVKKRLLTQGEWGLGTGTEHDLDVFVYMGDVQDHIITLQQALAHFERTLNQSHPTHLAQLRLSVNKAKSGTDKAIVSLTVISLGVLCVQTLLALASMNAKIPADPIPSNRYDAFAAVLALSVIIMTVYGFVVRHWWTQAKRRRIKML
ncbi:uncharacterized protein TRAVEDRAFT_139598 [Trametes versicolor FP-101664 SS1]|uniref:uncharacterized protein n=1 Tax=Trametes versicolor (strain FP-101664) TaxID=717944 RepID=UPI0004621BF2|nr:uncharacterized protein TRAVEDRAFT_139598 [Trametes versicolor FP-101664 SS1]EIW64600.1 hypothetical protein TRAVEDRAFT_139598 [Trametes versicolor FP-101664 SS1]